LQAQDQYIMKHLNIPGSLFSFRRFYTDMVNELDGIFVEVGVFEGTSFSYLVVEAINSGKKIECYAVDAFPWEDLYPRFEKNMNPLEGNFKVIKANSDQAAANFEDGSVSLVFIDANHTKPFVEADIKAWLPKIKKGGVISGHDYNDQHTGLCEAVNEAFGNAVDNSYIDEGVWMVKIK